MLLEFFIRKNIIYSIVLNTVLTIIIMIIDYNYYSQSTYRIDKRIETCPKRALRTYGSFSKRTTATCHHQYHIDFGSGCKLKKCNIIY